MSKTNRDKRGGHIYIERPSKKFTAKAMRKEAAKVIKEGLETLEYSYDDWYDDSYDHLWDEQYDDWSSELDEPMSYDDYDDYDVYDSYWDCEPWGVSSYDWNEPFDPIEHTVVTHQDVGRSLGDLLSDIQRRQA